MPVSDSALALAGTAFAQVPSSNDTSDESGNTGGGRDAINPATPGVQNTAYGDGALKVNTTGKYNTATGWRALFANTTGITNTVSGSGAMYRNTNGTGNTAIGYDALPNNISGDYNIAIGFNSGNGWTAGSYNIDIGNVGGFNDTGVIRIGTQVPTALQTSTYIAGIYTNTSVSGLPVVIDSNGQLGVTPVSSERFKTSIAPMGSTSEKLQQLRPVTFHLKANPQGALQYGLIAEEVAKVYPELVIRDQKGRIDGVRYDELAPMLLNQAQQDEQQITAQAAEIRELKQQQRQETAKQHDHSAVQDAKLDQLLGQLAEMHAALSKLQSADALVVKR
jgi:hypothetical protein